MVQGLGTFTYYSTPHTWWLCYKTLENFHLLLGPTYLMARIHRSWAVFVVDVNIYFLSLFTFRYHFLSFSCYWRRPITYIYLTLPHIFLPFVTLHLTLPYLISYLSLPYLVPYLTFCLLLPYLTLHLTIPYFLPYLTISLTLHFALPYLTS